MKLQLIAITCLTAIASGTWAQTTPPAGAEGTWVGEVTGANVYVRATAAKIGHPEGDAGFPRDRVGYPCLKLSKPAKVTVVSKVGDWLKILPPPDAFSVIAKRYVAADETGGSGTVTGDNVRVRAGTKLFSWNRWIDHYAVQLMVDKGHRVKIIGEGDDFYKISPPKGAFLYISAKYVKRVEPPPEKTDVEATPATQPEEGEEEQAQLPAKAEESLEEIKAVLARFEALEARLKAEFEKPEDMRDVRSLLAEYRNFDAGKGDYLKPYVDARIQFLETSIEHAEELQGLQEVLRSTAAKQREFELALTTIEVAPPPEPTTTYAARGILMPSAVFTGAAGAPKRFVIRDPATLRIRAYAQSTAGETNLAQYAGKEVALVGTTEFDEQLDANVVEVQQVKVLKDQVEFMVPPEPEVRPYTPPARPKIEPIITPRPQPVPKEGEPEEPAVAPEIAPKVEPQEPAEEPATEEPEPAEPEEIRPAEETPAQPEPEPQDVEGEQEPVEEPARPVFDEASQPSTESSDNPLPPTGLPMIEPEDRPADEPVNEDEFN
ncbi:MAG: SH3 domain-containing protein [Planctomycetota bacterium]|jgi:hypothetical protein